MIASNRISRLDISLLILVTLLWGLSFPIMKFALLTGFPPLTLRTLSFIIALLALGLHLWHQNHSLYVLPKERWPVLRVSTVMMTFWQLGLGYGVLLLSSVKGRLFASDNADNAVTISAPAADKLTFSPLNLSFPERVCKRSRWAAASGWVSHSTQAWWSLPMAHPRLPSGLSACFGTIRQQA
jgi:hypothetical protein